MKDLYALIAEVEALQRSARDELVADGWDEAELEQLADELAEAEPTEEEQAAFERFYGAVRAESDRREHVCSSPVIPSSDSDPPSAMTRMVVVEGWYFTQLPAAPDGQTFMVRLDSEIERAAQEVMDEAVSYLVVSPRGALERRPSGLHHRSCTWHHVQKWLEPEEHIDPERVREALYRAARATPPTPLPEGRRKGRRTSVEDG